MSTFGIVIKKSILFILFTLSVYSQKINPLDIVEIKPVIHIKQMTDEYVVSLDIHLTVKKNWHINSHRPNDRFLVPTLLSFDSSEGYSAEEITYPPGVNGTLPFSTKKLNLYTGRQTIKAMVNIAPSYRKKNITINGILQYQACNDEMCLFPVKKPFRIVVPLHH